MLGIWRHLGDVITVGESRYFTIFKHCYILVREPERFPVHPPLNSLKNFLGGFENISIQNFYVNTSGNWDNRVKIAIFGLFYSKIYLLQFYTSYLFSVMIGPTFGLKIVFYYLKQNFFEKIQKSPFFAVLTQNSPFFKKTFRGLFFLYIFFKNITLKNFYIFCRFLP